MTGPDVFELQEALLSLGYRLPQYGSDGDYGEETKAAVEEFQQDYRLNVDGAAGPDTLEALKNAYTHQDAPETGDTQDPCLLYTSHRRYKVLASEGAKEIDCVVVHIENPQDEKALNIALNKAVGEWEPVALADLLSDLQSLGYDLGATEMCIRDRPTGSAS